MVFKRAQIIHRPRVNFSNATLAVDSIIERASGKLADKIENSTGVNRKKLIFTLYGTGAVVSTVLAHKEPNKMVLLAAFHTLAILSYSAIQSILKNDSAFEEAKEIVKFIVAPLRLPLTAFSGALLTIGELFERLGPKAAGVFSLFVAAALYVATSEKRE